MPRPMIVCHAGAGHAPNNQPAVDHAIEAGWAVLSAGGAAVEAVLASVELMENDPTCNAGIGARYRDDGSVQLDAAVATSDGRLGAVMAIEETPNPIRVAAALLDEEINILVGDGARLWADAHGLPRGIVAGSERPSSTGTVGAVAIDRSGALAVASSTGGMSNQPRGRVGDTPLWGSGFWVDERIALAATGNGEQITRRMLCHRVALHTGTLREALAYGLSLFDPAVAVGLIGVTRDGEALALANTAMCRAVRTEAR